VIVAVDNTLVRFCHVVVSRSRTIYSHPRVIVTFPSDIVTII